MTSLRDMLKPNGYIILYKNGDIISNKKIRFYCKTPVVYQFLNDNFFKKKFDENIIFEYKVVNGIGESFILQCNKMFYVFKPFYIKKFSSFESAKEDFTNVRYKPSNGIMK
ncbi:hypothetical protein NAMH_0015 [Nautilia profundicola AmH]|uniref:Uncharacterized protein n=2 Tax=Nautilia TaxID=191291 RepID=B9L749_NAUPA|nr:hypothetical protein NAMH_0015 [Nautilia profundicola AmH]